MGRKKKYANVAEKQRAWRIRSGKQKQKVPLELRRGQRLGASESELRAKREDESWDEYHAYILNSVKFGRIRQEKAHGGASSTKESWHTVGGRRVNVDYAEPTISEEYYEIRHRYEKELEGLEQKRRKKIGKKK